MQGTLDIFFYIKHSFVYLSVLLKIVGRVDVFWEGFVTESLGHPRRGTVTNFLLNSENYWFNLEKKNLILHDLIWDSC